MLGSISEQDLSNVKTFMGQKGSRAADHAPAIERMAINEMKKEGGRKWENKKREGEGKYGINTIKGAFLHMRHHTPKASGLIVGKDINS